MASRRQRYTRIACAIDDENIEQIRGAYKQVRSLLTDASKLCAQYARELSRVSHGRVFTRVERSIDDARRDLFASEP